jgi:hypothetical protein
MPSLRLILFWKSYFLLPLSDYKFLLSLSNDRKSDISIGSTLCIANDASKDPDFVLVESAICRKELSVGRYWQAIGHCLVAAGQQWTAPLQSHRSRLLELSTALWSCRPMSWLDYNKTINIKKKSVLEGYMPRGRAKKESYPFNRP